MPTAEKVSVTESTKEWLRQFPLKKRIPVQGETNSRIMQVLELHRAQDRASNGALIRVRLDRATGELLSD